MARAGVNQLFYITHVKNLPSILGRGILSHRQVEAKHVEFEPIYDAQIVSSRSQIKAPDGRTLWDFANLYFQPRNAMLYRVLAEKSPSEIAIVAVRPDILNGSDIFIATGNAASPLSDILPGHEGRKFIPQLRDVLGRKYWNEQDGSKRKMMAECLVPDLVPPDYIQTIYVADHEIADQLKASLSGYAVPVIPEPHMFFQPARKIELTRHLSIIDGDMFFSRLQTLTVSVNTVGIMGKGLASRAKYQFPDVYVVYQDVCRNKTLQMGKPYLYKRESAVDLALADEPSTLQKPNLETWFLLFPTKGHWKEKGDINGIEKGMQWVRENHQQEQIKSLALPALGCGLGGLEWHDVGPLLCRYLADCTIPVWVYLPTDRKIPDELLTQEFLLSRA